MSVTYGFYNSSGGDRKYDALQFSSIFDGVIVDGVYASIGTSFVVKAAGGLVLNVGEGRAWFNHTWTLNDAVLSITAPDSETLQDRIDAIVIEVDSTETVRANSIKYISGTPSSTSPQRPTLTNTELIHQYPLCYISREHATTEIRQADITNMVGSDDTPFVTGILETFSISELLGQWEDELDKFTEQEESDFTAWFDQMKTELRSEQAALDTWISTEQTDFLNWYQEMKDQLSEDAAGNLQLQITDISEKEFLEKYDLRNKVTTITTDSSGDTTITETNNDESVTAITTFSEDTSAGTSTITTVVTPTEGNDIYTKTVFIEGDTITESYTKSTKS